MRPPRLAAWLLAHRLPAPDRDEILGDLEEVFASECAVRGSIAASRWYWRQAMRLAWLAGPLAHPLDADYRRSPLLMDTLRFTIRRLRRAPGASVASVLTLACGIGAALTAWTLLSGLLLHPLPVSDPDRLVVVGIRSTSGSGAVRLDEGHVYPIYRAVADRGPFTAVAAGGRFELLVTDPGGAGLRSVFFANHTFFDTLGVGLQRGRGFTAEDDRRGASPVAIVSDRFWRRRLDGSADVIGREIVVADVRVPIVGVAARGFRGWSLTDAPDVYLPMHTIADVGSASTNFFMDGTRRESPTSWVRIAGRLRPGMPAGDAAAQVGGLQVFSDRLGQPVELSRRGSVELTPIHLASIAEPLRPGMAQFARLLVATVVLLLLIGTVTVGMLLLVRTESRRDEFAMCLALGASRLRLGFGVALEGALVTLASAVLALPIAWWMLSGLRAFQLTGGVDLDQLEVGFDGRALAVMIGLVAGVTATIATIAAGYGVAAPVASAIRGRSGATPRITRRRARAALVVAQVAVSLVLVAGAGLFVRSLTRALSLNPGFPADRIATASVGLGPYGYSPERAATFFADLRTRLVPHTAIASVGLTQYYGGMTTDGQLRIGGEPRRFPGFVAFTGVDDRYFETMGLPILRGRSFTDADRPGAPRVAIVSESFANVLAPDGAAIGVRITEPHNRIGQPADIIDVVGVVPDVITSLTALQPLVLYMPIPQIDASPSRTVVVRAAHDAGVAIRETMATIQALDPRIAPPAMLTITARLARQMGAQQLGAALLGGLGAIAALLTIIGTYVLTASMTMVRQREMGIRAALGATGRQLGGHVLSEAGRLVGAGILVGLGLAWLGADLIRDFLFRVEPLDPLTLGAVVASIVACAVLVSLRPAWRAARIDLARVLREE